MFIYVLKSNKFDPNNEAHESSLVIVLALSVNILKDTTEYLISSNKSTSITKK